jgi:hypothetical protein
MLEKSVSEILDNPDKIYPESRSFGWHDITGQVLVRGVASTDPDWVQVAGGPMFCYRFAVNDSVWFVYHIPHDIVPNFPIHFHAHWMTNGTSTAAVTWEWSYMYAKGFNQQAFDPAGVVVKASQAGAGVAYRHMVTETDPVTIEGLTEPDGLVYCRLRRINNETSPIANNGDAVYLLTADIHYQSTNEPTINKAPNFYRDSVY